MANTRTVNTLMRAALGALVLLAAPLAGPAAAQGLPAPALEIGAGWVGFADDGLVNEGLIEGAFRVYIRPQVSIGPELVYIDGNNHSHVMVTGNVTWDALPTTGGVPPRVMPYLVAGVGVFQTRERFLAGDFTSTEGTFTLGAGLRTEVTDGVTLGVDARIGWELHVRVAGLLGLRIGR